MRRRLPDAEAIERARQDAERRRVEGGLPAAEHSDAEYEANRAAMKATRKGANKKR